MSLTRFNAVNGARFVERREKAIGLKKRHVFNKWLPVRHVTRSLIQVVDLSRDNKGTARGRGRDAVEYVRDPFKILIIVPNHAAKSLLKTPPCQTTGLTKTYRNEKKNKRRSSTKTRKFYALCPPSSRLVRRGNGHRINRHQFDPA